MEGLDGESKKIFTYLHPDTPCNGLTDGLLINAEIRDEALYEKFKEIYGTPKESDYDQLNKAEEETWELQEEVGSRKQELQQSREQWYELFLELDKELGQLKNNPFIKLILHIKELFQK